MTGSEAEGQPVVLVLVERDVTGRDARSVLAPTQVKIVWKFYSVLQGMLPKEKNPVVAIRMKCNKVLQNKFSFFPLLY